MSALTSSLRDAATLLRTQVAFVGASSPDYVQQLAAACDAAALQLAELRPALAGLYLATIRLNLARPASLAAFTKARKHARIALGAKVRRRP